MRCQFIDLQAGGLGTYDWALNHDAEEGFGATQQLERTAPTSGVGFVRQIGDPSPLTRTLRGSILARAQLQKFWAYYNVTAGKSGTRRTIRFRDPLGGIFEVLVTSFVPVMERVAMNRRGTTADEKLVKWTYTLTLEVVNVVSGWP